MLADHVESLTWLFTSRDSFFQIKFLNNKYIIYIILVSAAAITREVSCGWCENWNVIIVTIVSNYGELFVSIMVQAVIHASSANQLQQLWIQLIAVRQAIAVVSTMRVVLTVESVPFTVVPHVVHVARLSENFLQPLLIQKLVSTWDWQFRKFLT